MTNVRWLLALAAVLVLCGNASASVIDVGSSLTFGGTNAPDTFSALTTFSSTPVLVDAGAVRIWQNQVPTGGGAEWDVFFMETVNGGPLAGNINSYWDIVMTYTLSQAAYFDGVAMQWSVNGTPVDPLSNFSGICCAVSSNPILPGEAYYNSGFSAPLPAGQQTNWQQVFVSPYSFVSAGGIDASTANGFTFALHLTPQAPQVPEPASATLLGGGVLALVGLRRRFRRT